MLNESSFQMFSALITGSTGNVGSAIVEGLSQADCELKVIAATSGRNISLQDGTPIEHRSCPYGDRQKIMGALEGIDRVFLMIPFGANMVQWGRTFVECARNSNVSFIVRLSGLSASPDSQSLMARIQGEVDDIVRQSGIDYCILRCNSFMQNFSGMYRSMIRVGKLGLAHGDAGVSFIDTRDIAGVAVKALCSPGYFSQLTLDLHGPRALSVAEVVECISAATNKKLRYVELTKERARMGYQRANLDAWEIEMFTSLDTYLRQGYGAGDSAALKQILGRDGRDFESFSREYASLWQ